MNNILEDLICIRLVMVYLDNILIFGTYLKEHRQLVKEGSSLMTSTLLYYQQIFYGNVA